MRHVRQDGALGNGSQDDTSDLTSAFLNANTLVHLSGGAYLISSSLTVPAGSLAVSGAFCWQPSGASTCLDGQSDLGMTADNMGDSSAALAGCGVSGASAWLHVGRGRYWLASPVSLAVGTLTVEGSLDWTPPPAA